MIDENFDIIMMDDKEYVIFEKFSIEDKNYFVLNEIDGDTLLNTRFILREADGLLYSIDEEEEKKKVEQFLLKEIME